MSDRFMSFLTALENNTFLGLGVLAVMAGIVLPFVSPIQMFVKVWVTSVAGTVFLGLGVLLIGTGLVHSLTGKGSIHSLKEKRPISQKEFEKKYSEMSLTDSSANAQALEILAKENKPLNRKEIAEKSGMSPSYAAQVLKSFVEKGYVLEFQARGIFYYALAEKGLKLCEDFEAAASVQMPVQREPARSMLMENWLQKHNAPYYSERSRVSSSKLMPKQRIVLQQLVLVSGFLGGLFVHFEINNGILSTTSGLLTLTACAWLAITILCSRKVAGSLGLITLVLACMSGFIVMGGEPLTSLGVILIMSSTTIGALAALCSRTQTPVQPLGHC
jgi:DNA-binding MarR family transcriptional regulator